ncbi:hypothetical protein AOLI_G00216330 [Acnodon oligacanthus]
MPQMTSQSGRMKGLRRKVTSTSSRFWLQIPTMACCPPALRKGHLLHLKMLPQTRSFPPQRRHTGMMMAAVSKYSKGPMEHLDTTVCCLLGQGTGAAQWPYASRLVEAICLQLCDMYPRSQKISDFQLNRWGVVLRDYGRIRRLVLGSPGLMEATALQLFEINQRTLSMWPAEEAGTGCDVYGRPVTHPGNYSSCPIGRAQAEYSGA